MLPDGWTLSTIGEHVDLLTGHAFKSGQYISSAEGIKLLRGDNIVQGKLRWRDVKRYPPEQTKNLRRYHLQSGDFVIAMDRTWISAGVKVAEIHDADLPCLLVQRVARLRAKPSLRQDLLRQYFSGHRFEQYVKDVQTETAVPHISPEDIRTFEFPIPPLREQRRIAAMLDAWDTAIATADRLVEAKRARFAWLRDHVLNGQTRLRGYNNVWRTVRLADVVHEHGFKSDRSEPVFSVSVHKGLIDQVEHLGRSFSAADTGHYNRVLPGDIVYTKSPTGSFPLGIIKQSKIDHSVIVSPLYGVFTPDSLELGILLDAYFSSPKATEKYLTPLVQKGAKNTIAVTNGQFLQGVISIPNDERELVALADMIEASLEEIAVAESEASLIRQQKRGLMQLLLTGKLRVPVSIDRLLPDAQPELVAAE